MQYVSNKADFQRLQNDIVSGYKASKGKDKQKYKKNNDGTYSEI